MTIGNLFFLALCFGSVTSLGFRIAQNNQQQILRVCVMQPGLMTTEMCTFCSSTDIVNCGNMLLGANYEVICDTGFINETFRVCYFCTVAQSDLCLVNVPPIDGDNLTRTELDCVSRSCSRELEVTTQINGAKVKINSALFPFFG